MRTENIKKKDKIPTIENIGKLIGMRKIILFFEYIFLGISLFYLGCIGLIVLTIVIS